VNEEGQLGCNPFVGKEGKEEPQGKEGKEGKPGPPGPPGTPGTPGTPGAPGPPGPQGPEGKEGKEGKAGASGPAGNAAIANFSSVQNVASGQCLNYSEDEAGGPCPKKASLFPISNLLTGPIPANGATVTNLYAETNATVTGKDTVLVEAIDNTSGVALLSCTVNSTTKNHCSNTGTSVPVAAGDKIEVKLTAAGSSGNNKQWQVTFRY
jgi:Collagen triple helix repeat (20 copies)